MTYKIIVKPQKGSPAYKQGIRSTVWRRTNTKRKAEEIVFTLMSQGLEARYEKE